MCLSDIDGHIPRKKSHIHLANFERCHRVWLIVISPIPKPWKPKAVTHYSFDLLLKTESRHCVLGAMGNPMFSSFFFFQHLLQQCDLDSARSFAAKGFSLVPLWTNQKIPEIRGLRTRIRGSFWIACFNLQKRMNSSIQGTGLLAKVGKVGKAVPLKADSKCKGVAPKLGTCDGTLNLLLAERTLTRCLGPHATVQFFLISKQKPIFFLKLTMMTVGGLGGYAQNTLTERQGTGWLSKNLVRDRHTAIPACFIPPVASGLYGFDRARDLSNLFCWPWIPSHSQFMHLGGLMKPLSPAMMVYYKSTAGLMSFPTSETLLEGYHEDQTLRLTYIATDLSCLDPVHLRTLSIPSHPIPSTAFCQAVDT